VVRLWIKEKTVSHLKPDRRSLSVVVSIASQALQRTTLNIWMSHKPPTVAAMSSIPLVLWSINHITPQSPAGR